jgi:hypothetical protein
MASPLASAVEAVRDAFAAFRPEKPEDFEDFFKGLPGFFRDQAGGLSALAQRGNDEMPLDKSVVEELREIAALFAGLGDKADELDQHFRAAHETELRRAHEPRAGEKAWNIQ